MNDEYILLDIQIGIRVEDAYCQDILFTNSRGISYHSRQNYSKSRKENIRIDRDHRPIDFMSEKPRGLVPAIQLSLTIDSVIFTAF